MPWTITEIHPLLVHFPIALLSTGLFFDILAKLLNKEELEAAGFWTMFMGLISSPFTILTGLIAFLEEGSLIDLILFRHGILEFCAILFLLILFWVRIRFQVDLRYSVLKGNLYLLVHILVVGALFYGAHLGAQAADRI